MKISTIGIDLLHEFYSDPCRLSAQQDRSVKKIKRKETTPYLANLEPCLSGMGACGRSPAGPASFDPWGIRSS